MIAPAAPRRAAVLLGMVALALSLLAILAAPALPAFAEERLNATATCGGVTVTGAGFGDRSVLLRATDLRTGRGLAGPTVTRTTRTGGSGPGCRCTAAGCRRWWCQPGGIRRPP